MLLKVAPAFSLVNSQVEHQSLPLFSSVPSAQSASSFLRLSSPSNGVGSAVVFASKGSENKPLTGVVFEPFEEVKKELNLVPTLPQVSLARQKFSEECEAAINQQIKFFNELSLRDRGQVEKLMRYQNKRGGRVQLLEISLPLSEFDHGVKGHALHAMEFALSMEKIANARLLHLHRIALRNHDAQLADFVESEFLSMQVEAIKKIAEHVSQLRRLGAGHGVWHFNQMLLREGGIA
ncbi:ferritin-2, chloroplastic-like isoform X2 [Gossypium arboreum]|uniref:ferritin-2, chloroplastic-like isoform X2 n=1 Tax=Gossypium arboreum TaxID=29729 RepID=UPI0008191BD3|nr:ferritin-2, chloroplastic-like isoform X2 [Gossypium arboreum]